MFDVFDDLEPDFRHPEARKQTEHGVKRAKQRLLRNAKRRATH
jgi:hypothetical protein